MPEQSRFQRPVAVNRNRQPHVAARFAVDMVAAGDAKQLPAVALDQSRKFAGRKPISYRDFENTIAAVLLWFGDVDREAAFDGLVDVREQFVHRVTLTGATGNGRDLGPKAAFLCLVNDDLDFHDDYLL